MYDLTILITILRRKYMMKNSVNELAKTFRSSEIIMDLRSARQVAKAKLYTPTNAHLTNSLRYKRFVSDCNKMLSARKSAKIRKINSENISRMRKVSRAFKEQYLQG